MDLSVSRCNNNRDRTEERHLDDETSMSRTSAGIRSPTEKNTRSPGTSREEREIHINVTTRLVQRKIDSPHPSDHVR